MFATNYQHRITSGIVGIPVAVGRRRGFHWINGDIRWRFTPLEIWMVIVRGRQMMRFICQGKQNDFYKLLLAFTNAFSDLKVNKNVKK